MQITKHPFGYNYRELFPNVKMIGGFEGGAIYKAFKDEKHYLIIDEGTLADFLDEDDQDLLDQLVKVIEFETEEELNNYLEERNGNLIISIDMQAPTPSASGKTLVVATTHGNVTTDCVIDGKPVVVGLNAYIKK